MVERHYNWRESLKQAVRLLVIAGLVCLPALAGATTRVGNSEIQLVYEMQQTMQFKGDPGNNAEWVQWRNELRVEYGYEDLVEGGKLFGQYDIPFFQKADFSMTYRGRFDPVYLVRDKYRKLYTDDQQNHFAFPENDIREINLDADFGDVLGHKLSMRFGRQQIVWGESDLFRSIDIVNPLRIDQNGFVGEAFEDFRTPIWAIKFLYDIGNVGTVLSNVGWETFYTPRWRPGTNHLILEGGWDLQYRDPREYTEVTSTTSPGVRTFVNRISNFKKWGRVRNPWSIFRVGPNAAREAPDYGCLAAPCSPSNPGSRSNFIYGIKGSQHQIRGTKWENSMIGTRILGKAFDNFDFTVNYLFKRSDPGSKVYWGDLFDRTQPGTGALRPDTLYGFGIPGQDQQAGIDRCLNNPHVATFVGGWDAYGYNSNANPNDDRGATGCLPVGHWYPWTHVIGFTNTYNDFDYTGAVFRLEQSWSTNEPRQFSIAAYGGKDDAHKRGFFTEGSVSDRTPCPNGGTFCPGERAFRDKSKSGSAVWRSMIGFDLLRTWSFLPGFLGKDQMFLTGQHLMTYQNDNRPSNLNTFTNAPRDRHQRWEQLFTLSGSGFFIKGKLEPLWAYAYSVNAQQHLFLLQSFWHGLYFDNLDLFAGIAIYAGSQFKTDASFLNYYADRDTAWIRLQYYIL
jgi:hypothetical protein